MKILAAMSGGVDSSVAAAMLVEEGHDVTGVHLRLTDQAEPSDGRVHGCCGIADADDARRVAQVLDIPFYVWNLKDAFTAGVVDNFVAEYARGRTPNPCVRCNETIKFGALRERALGL
ncbi:MAG: tRNA 2-thiouridine(34) synthase MnmA, partial [Actinomycetota bacterium]